MFWPPLLVTLVIGLFLLFLALPALSLSLSGITARLLSSRTTSHRRSSAARILFLVPAHNEELLVGDCVRSVQNLDYPDHKYGIRVIIDNCTDQTEYRATDAGAECLVRNNPNLTGKPHALNWAIEKIDLERWDTVVILDADSTVEKDFARCISEQGPLSDRVCQTYFSTSNEDENWLTLLGGLLARMKYEIFYPLKDSAGLNSPLTGNGMCIGTEVLRQYGWFAFGLTENWEMYAKYTIEGVPIRYIQKAKLLSQESRSLSQGAPQRRRWSLGRVSTLKNWITHFTTASNLRWHQRLDAIAELADPGPALHASVALLLVVGSCSILPSHFAWYLVLIAAFSLSHYALGLALVLQDHPRPLGSLAALGMLPFYMAWRLVVAIWTLLTASDATWRKTERHTTDDTT